MGASYFRIWEQQKYMSKVTRAHRSTFLRWWTVWIRWAVSTRGMFLENFHFQHIATLAFRLENVLSTTCTYGRKKDDSRDLHGPLLETNSDRIQALNKFKPQTLAGSKPKIKNLSRPDRNQRVLTYFTLWTRGRSKADGRSKMVRGLIEIKCLFNL